MHPPIRFITATWVVMYYRNEQYPEAIDQLSLLVNGGKTEDGQAIPPVQLVNDTRIAEYYLYLRVGPCQTKPVQ